ncbi:GNAT family N-acetyltransferase [Vibrio sonorensis]|uniref:GNAT family N-acetyltransferase n=1 Tax=Vibrio sonorensis TaxID=1004316 RepID=UPI0008DA3627|nr:GNAT family N-acetyltransferase [Vibrio sonorensis]
MEFTAVQENHFGQIAKLITTPDELYSVCPNGRFPWDVEQIAEIAQQRSNLTVVKDNDKVVAFGNLYNVVANESAFVGNIIVSDEYKGKGIGKRLLEFMINECREGHNAVPHLSVFNYNTRAMLLYTKLGFKPYDVEQRANHKGEPVVLIHMRMEK